MDRPKRSLSIGLAQRLVDFINASPTAFHVVQNIQTELLGFGFESLAESDCWNLKSGGKYMVTRNGSALAAFILPDTAIVSQDAGFRIITAHTDSPNLRLKPLSSYEKKGYMQFAVEPYGGVLLNSWLNRDLSIAGRAITRRNGRISADLLRLGYCMVIPQLAIHLDAKVNDGLALNKQDNLPPIVGLIDKDDDHVQILNEKLRYALKLDMSDEILALDLSLYDTQPSGIHGFDFEFIFASRLDNLASCHAILASLTDRNRANNPSVSMGVFYDNEEVGNETAQGAASSFLTDVISRISASRQVGNLQQMLARSFCISADMAHAVHPNYTDKHDPHHMPYIGKGPVIKSNSNQRYATDARSAAVFSELCRSVKVPYQYFVARSNLACGSTVGPVTSAKLGVPTVDVGNPMLSMHSIREVAGVDDHLYMMQVFEEFFRADTLALALY